MRFLIGSAAALVVLACVACGSKAATEEGSSEDDSTEADDTDPTPTPIDPNAAPSAPAPTETVDAGAPVDPDAAAPVEAGPTTPNTQCAAGSIVETEGNDSEATANVIPNATGSFCGTLSGPADVDYVTFTLPADTKSLGFGDAYSAQGLAIDGTAGGQAFGIGQTPAYKPGQKYVFKVHTTGSGPVDYRFDVTIGK